MGNLFSSDNEQAEAEVEQHDGKQPPKELPKTPLMAFLEAAAENNVELMRSMYMEDDTLIAKHDTGPLVPLGQEDDPIYKNAIRSKNTALHRAAETGATQSIEFLLNLMADVSARDCIGSTPLHRAVSCGKVDAVRMLLGNGAKVESPNLIGNTAVHVAAYVGHIEIMQLLLQHGGVALLEEPNSVNMTPRVYATRGGLKEIIGNPGDALPNIPQVVRHDPTNPLAPAPTPTVVAAAQEEVKQEQPQQPMVVAPVQPAPQPQPEASAAAVVVQQPQQQLEVQVAPASPEPQPSPMVVDPFAAAAPAPAEVAQPEPVVATPEVAAAAPEVAAETAVDPFAAVAAQPEQQ